MVSIVEPDPSINYKIILIEPDPDIDYKIRILDPVTHSDSPGMSSNIVESIRDALESIVQEIAN